MDKKLLLQMEHELTHAANCAIARFSEFDLHVKVKFIENDFINAGVGKVRNQENTYLIQINTGVIDSLKMALTEKYMVYINDEDLLEYQFMCSNSLHNHFDNSTLKNSFMNFIVFFICYNILFHECGHILLGHCDGKMTEMTEHHNSNSRQGGYGLQASEMLADWYGIKMAMSVFLFSFAQTCEYQITNIDDLFTFRKTIFFSLVALFCQFNLFEATSNDDENEFSVYTLEHRTHPHPYIRLFYGCDAIKEAAMDVIEFYNYVDSNISEQVASKILMTVVDDLLCFLEKMGIKHIRSDILRAELIECHYSIRKKAASKKHSTKPYINLQMQNMPEHYLTFIRTLKNL